MLIGVAVGAVTLGIASVATVAILALTLAFSDFGIDIQVGPEAQTRFDPDVMPGRELLWSTETGAGITSAPTVEGGTVFVRDRDGGIRAFNALSGEALWTAFAGRGTVSGVDFAPVVANGVVYVAGWDGVLYAFDAATGVARWKADLGTALHSFASGGFPLTVADGTVYVNAKGISAFDVATGEARWTASTGGVESAMPLTSYSMPVVAGGIVYVGGDDGAVHAIDATTGVSRWSGERLARPTAPIERRRAPPASAPPRC